MFIHGQWAFLATLVCFAVISIEAQPVADDRADELRIAMNVEDDIKPNTENPNEDEPMQEPIKPAELDTNHIQVIKMPSPEECKEIIEELEEEIKREIEIETEIKEQAEMKLLETSTEEKKKEDKEPEQKMEQAQVMEVIQDSAKASANEEIMKSTMERSPRNMQMMEPNQKEKETPPPGTSSLNDDDIDKIIEMISFPKTDTDTVNAEKSVDKKSETKVVEPRTTDVESTEAKPRIGRAISDEDGKGYYILAFAPIEGPLVPTTYTKFDIIPIERSLDDDDDEPYVKEKKEAKDNFDSDLEEESRFLSRKKFNKYIRKMMRQIRKGTRKIQRKTHLKKSAVEEPTVENFVRKWYETNKKAKAAAAASKSSWFNWGQA